MIISMGSDHGGFELRKALKEKLIQEGITIIDHGPFTHERVDYPDYAALVAKDIIEKKADFGIRMCTTGIGVSISANKFHGIRAAKVDTDDEAEFSRRHNNANIICFGGKYHTPYMADRLTNVFIKTPYEGGRHDQRLHKITEIENQC
ncbi:MAG: ribose 5-phosphate isomerase B [Verrucomicrobia bacterium]|nr:MAG: ribose 5-phosphate isomerase B [Verrucomicrobiota bacterium]